MEAKNFKLTPALNCTLSLQGERKVERVLVLDLKVASEKLMLYIAVSELNKLLKGRGKLNLRFIRTYCFFILSLFSELIGLRISLQGLSFLSAKSIVGKLEFAGKIDIPLTSILYFDRSAVKYLETKFNLLHSNYLRKYSLVFNCPLEFPVIIGRSRLNKAELKQLKENSLIFLDQINLRNSKLTFKVKNVEISVETK